MTSPTVTVDATTTAIPIRPRRKARCAALSFTGADLARDAAGHRDPLVRQLAVLCSAMAAELAGLAARDEAAF